jgi:hypothetical protein
MQEKMYPKRNDCRETRPAARPNEKEIPGFGMDRLYSSASLEGVLSVVSSIMTTNLVMEKTLLRNCFDYLKENQCYVRISIHFK